MAEARRSTKHNVREATCHVLLGHRAEVGIREPSWRRQHWDWALKIEGIYCLSSFPNSKVPRAAPLMAGSASSEEQARLLCRQPCPSAVAKHSDQERRQPSHSPGRGPCFAETGLEAHQASPGLVTFPRSRIQKMASIPNP